MATYQFGMVGLGVMGSNLAYNIADHGFAVAGLDLDDAKRQAFHEKAPAGKTVDAFDDAARFAAALEVEDDVLAPAPQPRDVLAAQVADGLVGIADAGARPAELGVLDGTADHAAAQAAHDGFDFGELGHEIKRRAQEQATAEPPAQAGGPAFVASPSLRTAGLHGRLCH